MWLRRLPGHCRVRTCDACATRLRTAARDRSDGLDDQPRLAHLYASLAGEVWEEGDNVHWFDAPMMARVTALTGELEDFRPRIQFPAGPQVARNASAGRRRS